MIIYSTEKERTKKLLIVESYKVKIFFDDELLKLINIVIQEENKKIYISITNKMKQYFSK